MNKELCIKVGKWNNSKNKDTVHENRYTIFFIKSRSVPFRMRDFSDRRCKENQNAHLIFNNHFFFRKSCRVWDNVEKILWGWTDHGRQNGANALHDGYLRLQTLTICDTYCFSIATVVARTSLSVTYYVRCLLFKILFYYDFSLLSSPNLPQTRQAS